MNEFCHRADDREVDAQHRQALEHGDTATRVIGLKLGRTEAAVRSQAAKQHTSLKPTNQSPYGSKNN